MKLREKKLKFASKDGLRLHGTLAKPAGKLTGMMLMVHGITSERSEWGIFDMVAAEVAKDGVASLRFDFRGHGESAMDTTLITLDGILSDILAAWSELASKFEEDGASLGRYIIGSSYGGGLSYAAASRIGQVKHAFLLAPVFDYLVDLENCAPRWRNELKHKDHFRYNELKLGRPLANETMYFEPLTGAVVPTTVFHGTLDTDVSIELSRAVAARHSNVELVPIEGAGHVLNMPEDYELADEASWDFVRDVTGQIRKRID